MQKILEAQTPLRRANSDSPIQHLVWSGQNCWPMYRMTWRQKLWISHLAAWFIPGWRHISVLQAAISCIQDTEDIRDRPKIRMSLLTVRGRMPRGRHRPLRSDLWQSRNLVTVQQCLISLYSPWQPARVHWNRIHTLGSSRLFSQIHWLNHCSAAASACPYPFLFMASYDVHNSTQQN
jgi:hypothetical protein